MGDGEGTCDRLPHDVDQKIPCWLNKIMGKDEPANRSAIKSRFGIMGVSTSGTILGLWFSFLIILMWNLSFSCHTPSTLACLGANEYQENLKGRVKKKASD